MRKLNVGCGPSVLDGWINVDLYPCDLRVTRMDATESWPFSADSLDRVFTEHMIEHVPYAAGKFLLQEAYRTLKPGGRIRVSTPDLDFLVDLLTVGSDINKRYVEWACPIFSPGEPVCAESVVNNFVRAWGHQYIYSTGILLALMEEVGFVDITGHPIAVSEDPEFVGLENASRMPEGFLQLETITLEGSKPHA